MSNPNSDNIVKISKQSNPSIISRYKNLNVITDDTGDQYIESYESFDIPESNEDKYHVVQSGEKNRLDLISYKYYGTPLLHWVIAEANDISDMFEVEIGRILRIPAKSTLYGFKGVLL